MRIRDLQIKRRDYWLSLQAQTAEEGAAPAEVLDYRLPAFSFEDHLVLAWDSAYPGPNPTDLIPGLLTDDQIQQLQLAHGIVSFTCQGQGGQTYEVKLNTIRA
ncbi:hypothetical protein PT274_04760 [Leuconostocaceae bacterium ESL0958]|nr:hypothetical protein [Leuconostocaceae bacterium ESL0958]